MPPIGGPPRWTHLLALLVCAPWLIASQGAALAATPPAARGNATAPSILLRESPLPDRTWNLIARAGLAARLDPGLPSYYPRSAVRGVLDVGALRNVSRSSGVGANLCLGVDDRRTRVGVKARYRQWLGRDVSLDFAPGVLFAGGDGWGGTARYPGFVGEATLSLYGWVHVTAQVESVDLEHPTLPGRRDTSTYLGAQGTGPRGALVLCGCVLAFFAARGLLFLAQG